MTVSTQTLNKHGWGYPGADRHMEMPVPSGFYVLCREQLEKREYLWR